MPIQESDAVNGFQAPGTGSFRYRACHVCSVNWVPVLIRVIDTHSNDELIVECAKCKKTNDSFKLNLVNDPDSSLVTSNSLSNERLFGEENYERYETLRTASSELPSNNEMSQSIKCPNDEQRPATNVLHAMPAMQIADELYVTETSLSISSKQRCISGTYDESLAPNVEFTNDLSASNESTEVSDINRVKFEMKISSRQFDIFTSRSIPSENTSSISNCLSGESGVSWHNHVKTEVNRSLDTCTASHMDKIEITSQENPNVSKDKDIIKEDDVLSTFVKAENELSQVHPTLDCNITNLKGCYSCDCRVVDDTDIRCSKHVDRMDHSQNDDIFSSPPSCSDTLNRVKVQLIDQDDLLKGSILDLILCPIDISYTNRKPCCHQCRVCPKIFLHPAALVRHERTHRDRLPFTSRLRDRKQVVVAEPSSDEEMSDWEENLLCTHCDKKFDTSTRLVRHVRQVHGRQKSSKNGERPYVCNQCGERFVYSRNLDHHIKYVHGMLFAHVCTQCGQGFGDNEQFNLHMCNQHESKHPIIKTENEESVSNISQDKQVLNVHESDKDERPYVCKQCNKRFMSIKCLNKHIRFVHDKLFKHICTKCGTGCRDKEKLRLHRCHQRRRKHLVIVQDKYKSKYLRSNELIRKQAFASDPQNADVDETDGDQSGHAGSEKHLFAIEQISNVSESNSVCKDVEQYQTDLTNSRELFKYSDQLYKNDDINLSQIAGLDESDGHAEKHLLAIMQTASVSGADNVCKDFELYPIDLSDSRELLRYSELLSLNDDINVSSVNTAILEKWTSKTVPPESTSSISNNVSVEVDVTRDNHVPVRQLYTGRLRDRKPVVVAEPSSDEESDWELSLLCTRCNKMFDTHARLVRHIGQVHGGRKKIKCFKCRKSFENIVQHICEDSLVVPRTNNETAFNQSRGSVILPQTIAQQIVPRAQTIEPQMISVPQGNILVHQGVTQQEISANKNEYKIPTDRIGQTDSELSFAQATDSPELNVKCCMCEKVLHTEQSLRKHYRSMHCERADRSFSCIFCAYKTRHVRTLVVHVRLHTGERPYICAHCGEGCISQNTRTRHVRAAHQGLTYNKCQWCGQRFSELAAFKLHQQTHAGERPFVCTRCNKNYPTPKSLRYHILYVHEKSFKYICSECGKGHTGRDMLDVHMIRKHGGESKFLCTVCGKKYPSNCLLRKHALSHCRSDGEKRYACSQCDKHFSQHNSRATHIKWVHSDERPFKCTQCDKKYKFKTQLEVHGVRHTGKRPYACRQCDKTFMAPASLYRHNKEKHEVDCRYNCTYCDMKLTQRTSLARHIRLIHRNECPYVCDQCKRRFSDCTLLKLHRQTHF